MKDIDQWFNSLTGKHTDNTSEDTELETEVLKTLLAEDLQNQHATYQTRAELDWPALRNRLKEENLLKEHRQYNWFRELFHSNWKIAMSGAGATLAAIALVIVFIYPRQFPLKPQMSSSYTLYPHFRGGGAPIHTTTQNSPDSYTAGVVEAMEQHDIAYKLDRLPDGWQLEYFLPETLPEAAINTLNKWSIPLESGIWHIVHIKEK